MLEKWGFRRNMLRSYWRYLVSRDVASAGAPPSPTRRHSRSAVYVVVGLLRSFHRVGHENGILSTHIVSVVRP